MPPEPKPWKEMLNHPLRDHFRAAAHHEIRALIAKHIWDEVKLPKGARIIPTKVLKLQKALYGLQKSPKLWFKHFSATLHQLGLIPVPANKAISHNWKP